MKRMTTLASVVLFGFAAAPLAALADHHEGNKANEHSNAQSSEDATKGQERAAEVKAGAKVDASKAEADAKAKADKMKGDAKATADKAKSGAMGTADKAKAGAKATADKTTTDAAAKANATAGDATAEAKGKVDAAIPGTGASAEVEAGAGAK
jgi:colicin import membrane protein